MNVVSTIKNQEKLTGISTPILLVGPAFCGKSALAMAALEPAAKTIVIGTAPKDQPEMQNRIADLKNQRPKHWLHIEEPDDLAEAIQKCSAECEQLLVDSLNQGLASWLVKNSAKYSAPQLEAAALQEINLLIQAIAAGKKQRVVLVSAEVGAGVVSPEPLSRLFRMLCGVMNQKVAAMAGSVIQVLCGQPLLLKGEL